MASLQRYTDRRTLITGGGSGIGQATVLRILDEGGRVVAADISEAGLNDTTSEAGPHADRLTTVVMDVGNEQSVKDGVAHAVERLGGGLDTLAAHRAGGVDDDDLAGVTAAGLAGRTGATAVQRDNGVHVGSAVRQELVLVDGGGELGHVGSLPRAAPARR